MPPWRGGREGVKRGFGGGKELCPGHIGFQATESHSAPSLSLPATHVALAACPSSVAPTPGPISCGWCGGTFLTERAWLGRCPRRPALDRAWRHLAQPRPLQKSLHKHVIQRVVGLCSDRPETSGQIRWVSVPLSLKKNLCHKCTNSVRVIIETRKGKIRPQALQEAGRLCYPPAWCVDAIHGLVARASVSHVHFLAFSLLHASLSYV